MPASFVALSLCVFPVSFFLSVAAVTACPGGPATTDDDATDLSFATLATWRKVWDCGVRIVGGRDGDALERRLKGVEVPDDEGVDLYGFDRTGEWDVGREKGCGEALGEGARVVMRKLLGGWDMIVRSCGR